MTNALERRNNEFFTPVFKEKKVNPKKACGGAWNRRRHTQPEDKRKTALYIRRGCLHMQKAEH